MNAAERLTARIGIPLEERFFDAAAGRLQCMVAGSGPALVLVHGLNIGWGQWYAVLPELARRHTVYALDLTGAGAEKIDLASADIAKHFTDAVDAALRHFVPGGAVVVGHSIGAWAALKLASRGHASIRGVVAVSPVGFTDSVPPRFRALALRPVERFVTTVVMRPTRPNIEAFLGDVMTDRSVMAPEFVDYVFEHVNRPPVTHPLSVIHRLFRPFRFREEFTLSPEELSAVAVSVTVIHGALDPLIPFAAVSPAFGQLKAAKVTVLEGVGHVPPIERPAEFAGLIEEFATAHPW